MASLPLPDIIDGEAEAVEPVVPPTGVRTLLLAQTAGDISHLIDPAELARIGAACVDDYEADKRARKEWADTAQEALDIAAQVRSDKPKTFPWTGASNISFPLLTTAALQFNARAYPAVVKGDEAVTVKVVGRDNGRPMMENGQPVMGPDGQPAWQVPPGAKAARAQRVREYMNTTIFYRMEGWEDDTDALLIQLPIVGCAFRKVWHDPVTGKHSAKLVPALRVLVPPGATSMETTPRVTEEVPDVFPHIINQRMRSGFYRSVILSHTADRTEGEAENRDGARLLLEQHCLLDLDEDGVEEPYVVTIDHETRQVLRIEGNFGPEAIVEGDDGETIAVTRASFYVKYGFFPHPKGEFYDIGLGHLLKHLGETVNTLLNQLVDAGTAATAGGGFIASGVRLQGKGGNTIRFAPGEYRTVEVGGASLREGIYDRALPNPSPVTFQVLDMILGAARDVAGVKDVITGDASNTGQVGTTLALIEQGLQVYNAVYKRIFRSLKREFTILHKNVGAYATKKDAEDYRNLLDDPAADLNTDFDASDQDIRPVTDPASVTKMQKMARAQFLLGFKDDPRIDGAEIMRRAFEAADVEDIDKLIMPQQGPDPAQMALMQSKVAGEAARAAKLGAEAEATALDTQIKGFQAKAEALMAGQQAGANGLA